jgi:hypothetical protein
MGVSGAAFFEPSGPESSPENLLPLNTDTTALFSGSGNCETCHAAAAGANWSTTWGDVSQVQLWQSSMMANSARDPYWQAQVTGEVALFPMHQAAIEDVCTTCHSPIGRTQAHYNGQTYYNLAQMQSQPIALDGVSCTACHQIQDMNMGSPLSYNGNYVITNLRTVFGPFVAQFPNVMETWPKVNYTPDSSAHVSRSEMCATCHTLITESLDSTGAAVGYYFEQVPYIEWKNSVYEDQQIECQTCHMSTLGEPIRVSSLPAMVLPRDSVHFHDFIGGNSFMLRLMKDNAAQIGGTFNPASIDTAIERTERLLKYGSVNMSVNAQQDGDSLRIEVFLQNRTGHKFPTAYPTRRAWLHVEVRNLAGGVIFESGAYDTNGVIAGEDPEFEPHHEEIRGGSQVQIYEIVAGDYYGQVTHSLLKAYSRVKDNRLPPVGFSMGDATYDTVRIVGEAETDADFNHEGSAEGSGSDRVRYVVAAGQSVHVRVELVYQSINPRALGHLFAFGTPEIDAFESMYEAADKLPVIIREYETTVTSIVSSQNRPGSFRLYQNYPNPFNASTTIIFELPESADVELAVYNATGERVRILVAGYRNAGRTAVRWDGRSDKGTAVASGMYLIRLRVGRESQTRKVLMVK